MPTLEPTESNWEERFDNILDGIDIDETDSPGGWWETSTGEEFGKKKKEELKQLFTTEIQAAEERGYRRGLERAKEIVNSLLGTVKQQLGVVEPYNDEGWHKVFKKGSTLEWFNPGTFRGDNDYFGGIYPVREEISDEECLSLRLNKGI